MSAKTLYAIPGHRASSLACSRLNSASADSFPAVAVLPETLLAVELQRHDFSFDLSGVSQAVLRDPGATLQILRLAGEEYGDSRDRLWRIEDCISDLGPANCIAALERGAFVRVAEMDAVRRLWEESRTLARCAARAAERNPDAIHPAQAYLGGLLSCLNRIPALLGWPVSQTLAGPDLALVLADVWCLPDFLVDMFCEAATPGFTSRWGRLMDRASCSAGIHQGLSELRAPAQA